jgi:GNAT superfamily N-acetyltransferase
MSKRAFPPNIIVNPSNVTIRDFEESDALRTKELFRAGMESLLPSFYKLALFRNAFSQAVWATSATFSIGLLLTDRLVFLPVVVSVSAAYAGCLCSYVKSRIAVYIKSEIETNLVNIPNAYKGGTFLVALLNEHGPIIGMVGGENKSNGVIELKRMSVDVRIHSQGLGTMLVKALHDKARHLGFVKVRLATTSAQLAAIRLYRKCGYQLVQESPLGIPGATLCIFEKELRVGASW